MNEPKQRLSLDHYRGCLLGGALGDALGAPVEFLPLMTIRQRFGPPGIGEPEPDATGVARITDDTQMTLFTAEGLLRATSRWPGLRRGDDPRADRRPAHGDRLGRRPAQDDLLDRRPAHDDRLGRQPPDTPSVDGEPAEPGEGGVPGVVHRAYLRWLHTQGMPLPDGPVRDRLDGWLVDVPELHVQQGPGNTCLSALVSGRMGTVDTPINGSKGCGGIMRAAPVGLYASDADVFRLAGETAAITHGHPSGYLAAGCLARIVHDIVHDASLEDAIAAARAELAAWPDADECLAAIDAAVDAAVDAARSGPPSATVVAQLGEGWVAEEALAIALYCALVAGDDFAAGVRLAVNHSGDSDSTGAITGNILGALLGEGALPAGWLERLELRDVIATVAEDLYATAVGGSSHGTAPRGAMAVGSPEWLGRYPPW